MMMTTMTGCHDVVPKRVERPAPSGVGPDNARPRRAPAPDIASPKAWAPAQAQHRPVIGRTRGLSRVPWKGRGEDDRAQMRIKYWSRSAMQRLDGQYFFFEAGLMDPTLWEVCGRPGDVGLPGPHPKVLGGRTGASRVCTRVSRPNQPQPGRSIVDLTQLSNLGELIGGVAVLVLDSHPLSSSGGSASDVRVGGRRTP